MRLLAFLFLAPIVVAACAAGGSGDTPPPSESPAGSASPSPSPSLPPLDHGIVPADLFGAILSDATGRGANLATIQVVEASAVTWNDGSIDCPEPGMMYTMALVEGFRVVLEDGGTTYDYHAGQGTHFVLCPPERSRDPFDDGM